MGVMAVIGGIIMFGSVNSNSTMLYEAELTDEVVASSTPAVESRDVVEEARQQLERINQELDAEETILMDEIKQRESRLEKIRETRMSFQ